MIHMKAGTFGLPENGSVRAMTKESGPFKASKEQEARLVKLGLAVYVSEPEFPGNVVGIPEYSINNTASELREIGRLCGLRFKVGMSKAEMIAALDAYTDADTEDGVDIEDNGEDAPTFDASQAVQ